MVLSHQQMQDINIIFAALRAVDEEARRSALTQRIIYIFGIVGKHTKGTIPAHNRICARKALHQHRRNFELPRRGLTVAAFTRELVNIINGAKANNIGVDDLTDKALRILRGFTLITVDTIRAEIGIAERITRMITIIIQQACHHLDKCCLTCPRRAVAHEVKDKAAQIREGIELTVKVISHEHFR